MSREVVLFSLNAVLMFQAKLQTADKLANPIVPYKIVAGIPKMILTRNDSVMNRETDFSLDVRLATRAALPVPILKSWPQDNIMKIGKAASYSDPNILEICVEKINIIIAEGNDNANKLLEDLLRSC